MTLTLVDDKGVLETLITTIEHPFFVTGKGFIRADSLKVGMLLSGHTPRAPPVQSVDLRALDPSGALRIKAITIARANAGHRAWNLTVAHDHTFFVGNSRAWVHNDCDPKLNNSGFNKPTLDEADRLLDIKHGGGNGLKGKEVHYNSGGTIKFENTPGSTHELRLAVELAREKGLNIVVKGVESGRINKGGDFNINGVPYEIKGLNSNKAGAVTSNIRTAIEQAPNIIIDGRGSKLHKGTAMHAMRDYMKSTTFDPSKNITVYTSGGRIRYIPGTGLVRN